MVSFQGSDAKSRP
ncbi:BnaCnng48670D [Brassica napus]|uniref:BnaCnng48670D protein n=1 Tax=Brassica napus TaxID=3708 RepID=A0A078JKB3_BRANA|nr:BnaCnng48670D [Brassica napus]